MSAALLAVVEGAVAVHDLDWCFGVGATINASTSQQLVRSSCGFGGVVAAASSDICGACARSLCEHSSVGPCSLCSAGRPPAMPSGPWIYAIQSLARRAVDATGAACDPAGGLTALPLARALSTSAVSPSKSGLEKKNKCVAYRSSL